MGGCTHVPAQTSPELAYQITEGQNINAFLRDGPVAAHLLLRNGQTPRILVAFPAGNSGVGLWFDQLTEPANWTLTQNPQPVTVRDSRNRPLHGLRTSATIGAPRLAIRRAVLSNVRFLRDYESIGRMPDEILVPARVVGDRIIFARDRVDGAAGSRIELRITNGRIADGAIIAGPEGTIGIELTAVSGETPLTGLSEDELLNERAAPDAAARHALAFLSYREKFMAGSWRFNTYFGRDTLMSVRLLMPALRPAAIEAGIGAVLARMNEAGEVAHEEGLSEFAILERRRNENTANGTLAADGPTLDYGMIDDDYMLAPVAAAYLLEHASPEQARTFLEQPVASATRAVDREPAGTLLVRNLRYIVRQAGPFANTQSVTSLVPIKAGRLTGQWRDSEEGLGRGRYAYDVNAVLVPAALEAIGKLLNAGLLDPYLSRDGRTELSGSAAMADIWRNEAPGLFHVSIPSADARERIQRYAASVGVPAEPALAALGSASLDFHAIALDDAGQPIPIIHSDEGFALLFGHPSPADLETYVPAITRPFPAGLLTDIGLLVANPAQTDTQMQARFTPAAYHGAVVWSWQQALLAAGLERQLARTDLPASTRTALMQSQDDLWRAINATATTRNSELWSWAFGDGRYHVVPFGAGRQDADESNAAQLWSTVYLAVQPPRR
ncbi:MAG: hypothetical protein ABL882_07675 [Sphingopyxis sp.]